jgi:hypothetical protein
MTDTDIYENNTVENIKKDELVKRSPTAKKLYLRGDYCRETKKYLLTDYADIGRDITVKKGTVLYLTWDTSNEDEF